jgi:cold shock CspA family protein
MGRYKDYDRGPKRGGYDDDQKSDDRATGARPNYPRPGAPAERRPATASQVVGSTTKSIGTVNMYKADKGFGFVGQDGVGKDVFVHATALARAGLSGLAEGQRVRMQVGQGHEVARCAHSFARADLSGSTRKGHARCVRKLASLSV